MRDENLATMTLRQPNGVDVVVPRTNIESEQVQAWSLMPEGLENGLSPQDLADLLEYILIPAAAASPVR